MHRLSCTRCKERKVRCSRVVPRCNHCTAHNAECVYPERAKRLPQQRPASSSITSVLATASASAPAATDDAALGGMLRRLQRLEQQAQEQHNTRSSNFPPIASPYSTLPSPPVATPAFSDGTTSLSTSSQSSRVDVTALLAEAINQVQRHKHAKNSRDMISGAAYVPPELAKTWIEYYLKAMETDIFPSLINQKLLRMIPDLISERHVHIDMSMQILYYVVCFHGYMLSPSVSRQEREYASSCYVGCLRAIPQWKRQATGSTTDFAAAFLLTRIATAMFDYDVAWDMHKLTNDLARARNLQNIDGGIETRRENNEEYNDHRRGFWYLIQIDLYIRLLMDKPPTITAEEWHVNLPWLDATSQSQLPEGIAAIGFLISSRITMVLIRFFTLCDNPSRSSKSKMVSETEDLCHEIEHIFTDWKALEIFAEASKSIQDIWVLVDCLITGYTAIIFMLRKVEAIFSGQSHIITNDAQLPSHPLVLTACRHIISVSITLLESYPNPDMMSSMFGAYQVYAAVSRVYLEAIQERGSQSQSQQDDLQLLDAFSKLVLSICDDQEDLYPLIRGFNALNELLKNKPV